MPLLSTLASQQADLLMSDSLQFEEAVRRSLLKCGETQIPSQDTTGLKQESRDVYEIPALEMLTDRSTALQHTRDALVAQKIHLQEMINDYNHYVAMQAHLAERNDQISDDHKEHLESTLTWNSYNENNERRLHGLQELDGEIEEVEKQIAAQESAIKEYKAMTGEDEEEEEEDTCMSKAECLVCFEDVANAITPRLCQHTICNACTHTYIFTTKEMKLPAPCPADINCPGQIHLEQLQNHMSPVDLNKLYERALERELVDSGEAFYCSNSRCGEILEVADNAEIRQVECPSCLTRMCSSCKVSWHNNFTCEAYQNLPEAERSEADLVLLDLARKEAWKRCPKCKTMISLATGCNHMTCRCSYEFCYVCAGEWRKEGCPTGCALWDENNLVQEPILDPPVAFVQAARANIPGRLLNPPRGINLVDLDPARTHGPLRRSLLELECMYCDRQFGQLSALSKHYNFTQQHDVFACCGKVFLNLERLQQHGRVTHG